MPDTAYRRNVPLFIAFRVFFNARWYYPVLAILFLDLGLTVGQYAMLNVAWAAAIVGLEVPSGALADYLGRRRMVVFAAMLMVIEMLVFAFAPRGNPSLLFILFFINRIFSGAAEASASGADEALAYDSLAADGREKEWPQVLDRVMRWQSVAFFLTMMAGAALYDEGFMRRLMEATGLPWEITKETAMRLPILFTLGNAVLALGVAFSMREPPVSKEHGDAPANPWKATLAAGRWIWITPAAFAIILAGLCFDSIVRLFLTFEAGYFRVIGLPTASFGIIAAVLSLLGFVVPLIAKRMVEKRTMWGNFSAVAVMVFTGLLGAAFVLPWPFGLLWLVPLGMAMSFIQFFVSHYLNGLVTDSRRRATILSFRGLAFNLAYGAVGLLFAGLTKGIGKASGTASPDEVFARSLGWLPWYFLATLILLAIVVRSRKTA
ncbi:MAG: MFS transporter [Verrucomicrobiaceae bacterium]|nr:MAG: MFS transporter [Verrucomicrobiaceae bacterium]